MGHLNAPSRRKPGRLLAALAITAGLIGAACGGDDGGTSSETTASGSDTTTAEGTDSTAAATTVPPPTTEAGIEPVAGGKVIMGIEADTSSPWRPA